MTNFFKSPAGKLTGYILGNIAWIMTCLAFGMGSVGMFGWVLGFVFLIPGSLMIGTGRSELMEAFLEQTEESYLKQLFGKAEKEDQTG